MSGGAMVLHGEVEDSRDERIRELLEENRELRDNLRNANAAATHAKRDVERAVAALRTQLKPLHLALKAVFGEIDAIGGDDSPQAANPRVAAVWENWKQKLPGATAKIIDALQLHGEMNGQQLAIAIGCHRNSIPQLIYKLNKAGLIQKNGGRFSLKSL